MNTEIRNYCQRCLQCQRTTPHQPALTLLVLLPIISVSFERVGIDLVAPLPKSTWCHEYILIMDLLP